jgi:hypothetical protein
MHCFLEPGKHNGLEIKKRNVAKRLTLTLVYRSNFYLFNSEVNYN